MHSHILWQNAAKTVTLIDIPRSIVESQGFNRPENHNLLSAQPREDPHPSSEPKSAKARAKLMDNTVDQELHAEYRNLLTQALQEVRQVHDGEWCLPRPFVEEEGPRKKKRKLDDAEESDRNEQSNAALEGANAASSLPHYFLSSLARSSPQNGTAQIRIKKSSGADEEPDDVEGLDFHFQSNESDREIILAISQTNQRITEFLNFQIPPNSTFYLGDCTASSNFRKAVRKHAQEQDTRSTFDFILLDPPWPNRSIKRTHKTAGATYNTIRSLDDLGDMILDMQLESHMAEDALIGIWITNKQAARDLVLGSGGLFECWGVELLEEWIWLKTTVNGEPTSVLDALWKKPYEVLLLGRKRRNDGDDDQPKPSVKRRVIVGVPDLHSRKPCLKSLIKSMMPDPENYRALEIFARHLVAGWCSWGDECIKFNCEGFWRQRHERE